MSIAILAIRRICAEPVTEKELFIAICKANPAAIPVFAQCWWLNAVSDHPDDWNVVISMKGEQVTGIWPYLIQERFSITMMRNPRLTPYLGPYIFFPSDIKDSNRDSFEYKVTEQLLAGLPDADVWRLSLRPGFRQAGILRRYGLKIEVQQSFILNLEESEEQLFLRFKDDVRRNIRVAERELQVQFDPTAIAGLYDFQKVTLEEKRVNQPYSEDQLQTLLDASIANNSGALWVAREKGTIQAIIWNVWDQECSYYLMGGKNPDMVNTKAMSLLLWHCILEAKRRGNKYFDFEGSMDNGVERFFRSFGAERALYLVLKRDGHWLWKLLRALRIR